MYGVNLTTHTHTHTPLRHPGHHPATMAKRPAAHPCRCADAISVLRRPRCRRSPRASVIPSMLRCTFASLWVRQWYSACPSPMQLEQRRLSGLSREAAFCALQLHSLVAPPTTRPRGPTWVKLIDFAQGVQSPAACSAVQHVLVAGSWRKDSMTDTAFVRCGMMDEHSAGRSMPQCAVTRPEQQAADESKALGTLMTVCGGGRCAAADLGGQTQFQRQAG